MTRTRKNLRRTLNLAVAVAFAAALAIPALTHDAPLGGWTGLDANTETMPINVPEWSATYAEEFPGCTDRKTATPTDLVVVDQRGEAARVAFDVAWNRGHNAEPADDVFVVGWCGR